MDFKGETVLLALDDPSDEPKSIIINGWCTKCGALKEVPVFKEGIFRKKSSWIKTGLTKEDLLKKGY